MKHLTSTLLNPALDDSSLLDGSDLATAQDAAFGPSALSGEFFAANGASAAVSTASVSGSYLVTGTSGFSVNLVWDAAAMAAPAAFRTGIEQAAQLLANELTDRITVNVNIDYSGTGGGAGAGPDSGYYVSYSTVRSDLIKNATPGITYFNGLPATSSIQGQSNVAVWNAQMKLFGLISPNSTTTDDASATFATDISSSLLEGVAFHELTHALGRVPYGSAPDIFDLFRYTSPGTRLFSGSIPAPAAYLSVDGGTTALANYGRNSDPSDFLNTGIQGSNDPLNEYYSGSTIQGVTLTDLVQMEVLGYHVAAASYKASYSAAGLVANMPLLQAALPLVSTISLTDSTVPTISLTTAQYTADAAVLAKVSSNMQLAITGTTGSDTISLAGFAKPVTVSMGGDSASVSAGLGSATLSFIGTPDALTLGTGAATVNYTMTPSSGIETIQNFAFGLDTLNINLSGAASSVLKAADTSVGGVHAIDLYSSADPSHGVVLEGLSSTFKAASLLSSHTTFSGGHALIA